MTSFSSSPPASKASAFACLWGGNEFTDCKHHRLQWFFDTRRPTFWKQSMTVNPLTSVATAGHADPHMPTMGDYGGAILLPPGRIWLTCKTSGIMSPAHSKTIENLASLPKRETCLNAWIANRGVAIIERRPEIHCIYILTGKEEGQLTIE